MAKITMALGTPIVGERLEQIKQYCDIKEVGELKYGVGNRDEARLKNDCLGCEMVVLGDDEAGADTINAWADSGMKFIGVAKGTPVTVDNEAIKARGLQLSYTPGRNAVAVAEYCMGMMIAATRNMAVAVTGLQKGEHLGDPVADIYDYPDKKDVTWGPLDEKHPYTDYGIGFELHGKTLGLAGFGAIGALVGKYALAFGMKVLAYDPFVSEEKIAAAGAKKVDLDTMLAESDIVSIHLPVLPDTKNSVNKTWFTKMKKTAWLVNSARAAVIDERDFVEALQNGDIAGAAIDVYWQEPVPANHPLLKMRNCLCSPHMAGLTTDIPGWSGEIMAQDVLAYCRGEERTHIWRR